MLLILPFKQLFYGLNFEMAFSSSNAWWVINKWQYWKILLPCLVYWYLLASDALFCVDGFAGVWSERQKHEPAMKCMDIVQAN